MVIGETSATVLDSSKCCLFWFVFVFFLLGLSLVVVVFSERRPRSAVCVCVLGFLLLLQTENHRNSLVHSVLRLHSHDGVDFVRFYW